MMLYVSNIEEAYKDIIIGHLENSGTEDLLLHIEIVCCACAVDEERMALTMVLYCSGMMYKYYFRLGYSQ